MGGRSSCPGLCFPFASLSMLRNPPWKRYVTELGTLGAVIQCTLHTLTIACLRYVPGPTALPDGPSNRRLFVTVTELGMQRFADGISHYDAILRCSAPGWSVRDLRIGNPNDQLSSGNAASCYHVLTPYIHRLQTRV